MKHLTIGTAGHVDHGKTTLIKSLTGFDCDTHKDEKKRGITINLGFTHLKLPSGITVGIVDMPGHKDFIHTMAKGSAGIDIALLVIAANEGLMQQTREHINIMNMLGLTCGLTVITKTDTTDSSTLSKTEDETKTYLNTTFLKNSPIVKYSAITGEGLEDIVAAIDTLAQNKKERPCNGPFRMFVDRVFSKPGFGTIVTGSALNGTLRPDSQVHLHPKDISNIKVKNIERFDKKADSVSAGDRTAINLAGIKYENIKRGMVIADRSLHSTSMIDAKISLFKETKVLRSWSDVMFHAGGYSFKVKIHILNDDLLKAGESGFAQIHLPSPSILRHGDCFIIRSSSGERTLGGGYILDSQPLHHKRRRSIVTDKLKNIADNGITELIAQKVEEYSSAVSLTEIAKKINFSEDELLSTIKDNKPTNTLSHDTTEEILLLNETTAKTMANTIIENISSFQKENKFEKRGLTEQEIANHFNTSDISETGKQWLTQHLITAPEIKSKICKVNNTWTINNRANTNDTPVHPKAMAIENFLKDNGQKLKIPTKPEWATLMNSIKINEKELKQILFLLAKNKLIYKAVKDIYLHSSIVDDTRIKLIDALKDNNKGITVAEFRDLIQGNRKIAIAMLAIFDNERTTIRKDDYRFLKQ